MSRDIQCYRCGESLAALSLPLSRRDQCPSCDADLHVCRMCVNYDRTAARQCIEDGADDVGDKEKPNFCDWFKPASGAFDPAKKAEADAASQALHALFGDES